jgi:Gpi18-like mannosyltransferase
MTVAKKPFLEDDSYLFPLSLWLFSRLLLLVVMGAIAPLLPAPEGGIAPAFGWGIFAGWDGQLYRSIVTQGYGYNPAQNEYTVAFFPLFPLLTKLLTLVGLPFEISGFIVNNTAFLLAVLFIFDWVKELYGTTAARWTIIALVWFPFSLFGTVTYTEGLFLLLSSRSLRAFQRRRYLIAGITGALATATRLPGIALLPTFLWVSWREKRTWKAYLASLMTSLGVILYSWYCYLKFGDALIFLKAQKAWQPAQDFWGQDWLKMFMQVLIGSQNWRAGRLVNLSHPLLMALLSILAYLLWRSRFRLGKQVSTGAACFLTLIFWLVAGIPFINSVTVLGGAYLVWLFRQQLGLLATYAFLSFGIIFSSGRATSAERYTYAIVSVIIALGLWLEQQPRWRYPLSLFFGLLLAILGLRFAQNLWAG